MKPDQGLAEKGNEKMTEMTKIPQPEIEAYHAGYQAGYENGKRDAVRHGYWKEDGDIQICSECGEEHCWADYRAPYCETCGAKMIGEMQYKMLYHSAFPSGKEQKNGQD